MIRYIVGAFDGYYPCGTSEDLRLTFEAADDRQAIARTEEAMPFETRWGTLKFAELVALEGESWREVATWRDGERASIR